VSGIVSKRLRNTSEGIKGMQNVTSKTNIRRSAKALSTVRFELGNKHKHGPRAVQTIKCSSCKVDKVKSRPSEA
jgi:hypothetical protein